MQRANTAMLIIATTVLDDRQSNYFKNETYKLKPFHWPQSVHVYFQKKKKK